MRPRSTRRTATAVICALLFFADGAGAQEQSGPTPATNLTAPTDGALVKSSVEAVVRGDVTAGADFQIERVDLTLTRQFAGEDEAPAVAALAAPPGHQAWTFAWPEPPVPFNDTYTATASAVGTSPRFGRFRGPPDSVTFQVQIPPAKPTGLKVALDQQNRKANLTWNRNPEPDTTEYLVQRAFNDGAFDEGTVVAATSHTDDLATAEPGSYRYRIVALRRQTQVENDPLRIPSPEPSAESKMELAGAPTAANPSTTSPPTTRRTTGTTARPARNRSASNRVDLRRFGGATSTIPDGSLEPEEGAFGDLKFGERQEGRTDMTITELGEPVTDDGDERPTTLLFFAGGLLAFVVLMQLRWLKNEVDRVPLEEVPPGP